MAVTLRHEETLAPKPSTVSSTSSIETFASLHNDGINDQGTQQTVTTPQSIVATGPPVISSALPLGADGVSLQRAQYIHPAPLPPTTAMQKLPSSISLVPRESQLHLSPSTGVVVPTSVASANTVPEFLYQLTKMLSDSNREVIEWSHGEYKLIVIPVPMTFLVFVMPTFEFSRP
jgi:hypothetical protein